MTTDELIEPFESIESAQDFVDLLARTVLDSACDLKRDRKIAESDGEDRRVQAIDLALYKMKVLTCHLHKSRRLLNDLRTLRRLLLEERTLASVV